VTRHSDRVPLAEALYREQRDRTVERITPGEVPPLAEAEHVSRYLFVARYVQGKRLLDAGCGVGYGSSILLAAGASQVLALDRSPDAVSWARSRYGAPRLDFREASFPPLPFPDGAADVVCALEIVEHLEEDTTFVMECARVLAPGGVAIFSTPNKALTSPGWVTAKDRYHVREYYENDFRDLLAPHFSSVAHYGQCRSARVARFYATDGVFRRLAQGPFAFTKMLIPKSVRRVMRRWITSAFAGGVDHNANAADFIIEAGRTSDALSFLAVCRR
jgi:2-polyprenyl-3-methyl-5-hydroxy-6-metoxy-1,4-benzoquinol methylase